MYASLRHYHLTSGSMDDVIHSIDTEFADALAERPGFVAYHVMALGSDALATVTIFRDKDAADQSADMASRFVREKLGDVQLERISAQTGEVQVSRAQSEVLQPAHH